MNPAMYALGQMMSTETKVAILIVVIVIILSFRLLTKIAAKANGKVQEVLENIKKNF
jgi:hypothetical protein